MSENLQLEFRWLWMDKDFVSFTGSSELRWLLLGQVFGDECAVVSLLENVSAPSGGSSDRCSSDGQMCEDHIPDSLREEEPLGIAGP